MKNLFNIAHRATLLVVIVLSVITMPSCASNEEYVEPTPVDNSAEGTLSNQWGKSSFTIKSEALGEFNISIVLDSLNIKVSEFGVESVEDPYTFSDGQKSEPKWKGELSRITLVYIDTVSEGNRLRVTPNYKVEYTLLEQDREVTLAPYYYQNVPAPTAEPEVVDVVDYIHEAKLINNGDGSVNFALQITKVINNVESKTWKINKVIARVGEVSGSEYFVINNQYSQESGIRNETTTTTTTGTEKAFSLTTREKNFYWHTTFNGTAGEVKAKNEIIQRVVESVVFTDGDYRYEYNFSGNTTATTNKVVQKEGIEGKYVNGESEISPYIGTYVLSVESTVYSPQVTDLNNVVYHSSTAESHLYQR